MNAPLPDNLVKPPPASLPDLAGLNIMVDAYNIDMAQGTGIKTYGLALVSALKKLKANVSVLHGRDFWTKDDITDVLFFDYHGQKRPKRFRRLRQIMPLMRAAFGGPQLAIPIAPDAKSIVIRPSSEQPLAGIQRYNATNCFRNADLLFNLLRRQKQVRIPDRVDIWHATYLLPLTVVGAKKITTVHDCIPFRLPWTTLDDKQTLYDLFRAEIQSSDLIVAVSESSKNDTVKLFDVDPDKIVVTYEPVHIEPLTPAEQSEVELVLGQNFNLQPQQYILYVGAIEPKKNLPRLIEAYLKTDIDLPLVVVGKKAWLWRQELAHCRQLGAFRKKRVQMLNYVSYDHLRYLYAGASFFVFPSLYEGFGLPPLEAMVSGVPVLTSNTSSLPEVCGDAALYVDPENVGSIRAGLERLAADAELRAELKTRGLERAKLMSVDRYLERLLQTYARVL